MNVRNMFRSMAVLCVLASITACTYAQMGASNDRRKSTSIQTASLDVGKTKNAIAVRYLNLPWGEKTFSYLEEGGNAYYSNRKWPVAHLTLAKDAVVAGTSLKPGDYILILTPKGAAPSMTLSLATYAPAEKGGTFLTPGDVFTDVPAGAAEVVSIPVSFAKGQPQADELKITVEKASSGADIKIHYGDRGYTQNLRIK